jgi:3-dehydroquinate dehydratase II
MRLLVLHGPNLNLLGRRDPATYGRVTLAEIDRDLQDWARAHDVELRIVQSNHEGVLIDEIHASLDTMDGIVLNPGGLAHTSLSLRDAVAAAPPTVVVHLTNIYAREAFRHRDLIAPACLGGLYGFGTGVYRLALGALLAVIAEHGGAAPASEA